MEGSKKQVKRYAELELSPTLFKLGQAGREGERPAHQTISITSQVMLMTGQFSHKEGGLTINGDIKGLMCPMVVDTGANVKVVRLDMLGKRTLSRLRATNNVLKTAADETAGSVWKTDPLGQDWGYASLA